MFVQTPPMGWNSWNTFTSDINEKMIMETADAMVDQGLLAAGYEYLVIDDCWSERERDSNGNLVASHEKFPRGMKFIADYVHSKGLKFGMYSCAGIRTCGDYPGSFGHEFQDAKFFAENEVDFLKYDFCYVPTLANGPMLYNRMSMALKASGREILFSACNWGSDDVNKWIRSTGASMYRSTGDITDTFQSIKSLAVSQIDNLAYSAPGCFNDIDMLVAGLYGKGNIGFGDGCTDAEYRLHFALWCMFASPLMIGADVRSINEVTKKLLTNKDLIAINQDPEARPPFMGPQHYSKETPGGIVFFKHLSNNEYAIGFFNFGDKESRIDCKFYDYGIDTMCGFGFHMTDLFTGEDAGVHNEIYQVRVPSHDCKIYKAKLVRI